MPLREAVRFDRHDMPVEEPMRLRKAIRFDHWWRFKIPPVLSIAAAILLMRSDLTYQTLLLALGAVWSICCVAAYGHLVNDTFDVQQDRLGGKPNAMSLVGPAGRFASCTAAVAAGLIPLPFLQANRITIALLLIDYLLPMLYSVPPVRLKERGVLGLLSDALAAHVIPVLFVAAVLSRDGAFGDADRTLLVVAFAICSFIAGVKGFFGHQLNDREADLAAGVRTLTTGMNVARAVRARTIFSLGVELPAVAIFVVLLAPRCPLAVAAIAFYVLVETTKWSLRWRSWVDHSAKVSVPNVPFANNEFHEAWLPAALFIQLALRLPRFFWLPLVPFALFPRNYLNVAKGTCALLKAIGAEWRLRYGGKETA